MEESRIKKADVCRVVDDVLDLQSREPKERLAHNDERVCELRDQSPVQTAGV